MKAIYGLYPQAGAAQRAVDALRAEGIPERDITIVSSEPVEEYEFSRRDAATWMHWIAAGGGVLGLSFGIWLTTMTQRAWPIVTGGMPIVSWWPNLIIMFELTMLGAILATVITLVITAIVSGRERVLYDPAVSDGLILVGVQNPPRESVANLERVLTTAGVARVKRVP